MKDVIERLKEERYLHKNRALGCEEKINVNYNEGVADGIDIAIKLLNTPSPSPGTWEEALKEAYELGVNNRDSADVEYPVIDGNITAKQYALDRFDVHDFDHLSTRYPLHQPMEWVNNYNAVKEVVGKWERGSDNQECMQDIYDIFNPPKPEPTYDNQII